MDFLFFDGAQFLHLQSQGAAYDLTLANSRPDTHTDTTFLSQSQFTELVGFVNRYNKKRSTDQFAAVKLLGECCRLKARAKDSTVE